MFFCFCCITNLLYAQNHDSLLVQLQKVQNPKQKIELLCELSSAWSQESFSKAWTYGVEAKKLSQQIKWPTGIAKSYMVMGYAHDYRASYDSAVYYYIQSLKVYEAEKDLPGQSAALNNVGICYMYSDRYKEALVYYERSLEIEKKLGNEPGIADSYNNMAVAYRNTNQIDLAEKYYRKALDLYSKNKMDYSVASVHVNLGLIWLNRKNINKAIQETHIALDYYKKENKPVDLTSCYNSMADLFLQNKQLDSAAYYAQLSLNITRKADLPDYEVNALMTMIAIDTLKKDYATAVQKMIRYNALTEKLHQGFKNEQIEKYRNYYDLDSKDKAITSLKTESAGKDEDLTRKSNQLTTLVVVLVVFVVLLAAILYVLLLLRKTKKNVEEKNKEIEKNLFEKDILLKEIHHRVKNNLQVVSSLLSIQARYVNDPKALQAINDSKDRVRAISLLHQEIYRNDVLRSIYADQYFDNLCRNIQMTFDPDKKVQLTVDVGHFMMDIDQLVPYSLMVNELLTNAYKYGVQNKGAQINLHFTLDDKQVILQVKDNGPGMHADFKPGESGSLGYRLISIFAQKLEATIDMKNENGCQVTIKGKIAHE